MPYVEEMKLFRTSDGKKRKYYYFSKNLNATRFNTVKADVILQGKKSIRKRVFLNRMEAEKETKRIISKFYKE